MKSSHHGLDLYQDPFPYTCYLHHRNDINVIAECVSGVMSSFTPPSSLPMKVFAECVSGGQDLT